MELKKTIFLLIVTLCCSITAFGQFVDVQVNIEIERMSEQERRDLKTFEQQLPAYFENHDWIDNVFGIQLPIKIDIFPQGVNSDGFERVFTAQLFISTNSGDQRVFEKGFKMVYNTNDPLTHSTMIHPLTSVFDFYAYILLAGETDTYEILGGNHCYDKAKEVATRAQMSERPQGWRSRLHDLDELTALRYFRKFKYYFWTIIDLENRDQKDKIPENIDEALSNLEKMFRINARERHTHIFLDVHAKDFMAVIKDYGTKLQQEKLIKLNPDNEKLYKKILK